MKPSDDEIEQLIAKYRKKESEPNIFKILKLSDYEIRHSNFLSWLFNPKAGHGLGNIFFKTFIKNLFESPKSGFIHEYIFEDKDFDELEVIREFKTQNNDSDNNGSIDVVIKGKRYIWIIENKYGARETKQVRKNCKTNKIIGQLEYYWTYINQVCQNKYKNLTPVFIFLDTDKRNFVNACYYEKEIMTGKMRWSLATYRDNILPCITELFNIAKTSGGSEKVSAYINEYKNLLNEKYNVIDECDIDKCIETVKNTDLFREYKFKPLNVIHNFIWWNAPAKYGDILWEIADKLNLKEIGNYTQEYVTRNFLCVPKNLNADSVNFGTYPYVSNNLAFYIHFCNNFNDADYLFAEIVFTSCNEAYKDKHDYLKDTIEDFLGLNFQKSCNEQKIIQKCILFDRNEYFENIKLNNNEIIEILCQRIIHSKIIENYTAIVNKLQKEYT